MSYTLKTTGVATALLTCVIVDQDGVTTDKKSGTGFSVDASAGSPGTGSWKGTTRKYQPIVPNTGYNYYGIRYATTPPVLLTDNGQAGAGVFIAFHTASTPDGFCDVIDTSDSGMTRFWRSNQTPDMGYPIVTAANQDQVVGTTMWPTDGTKFSAGFNQKRGGGSPESSIWYCPEGTDASSIPFENTVTTNDDGGNSTLNGVGGLSGASNGGNLGIYLFTAFNRILTLAEFRSLHNDWFGTLFEAAAAGVSSTQVDRGRTLGRGIMRGMS